MTEFDTDILAGLVTRKRECLLRLRAMVGKQLELAVDGNVTSLLDVLATKQRVIVELQDVETGFAPFRDQDPERRLWRDPQTRARCAEELGECQDLMAQIMLEEKKSEREMVRHRDETGRRLHGAHQADIAREAYTAQPQAAARRLDLSSDLH